MSLSVPFRSTTTCWSPLATSTVPAVIRSPASTSLGLGFLLDTTYLLSPTAVLLSIAVVAPAYRAKRRRGNLPFALGIVAAAVVPIGKLTFESDPAMYVGLAILIGASLWNTWPQRQLAATCQACVDGQTTNQAGLGRPSP